MKRLGGKMPTLRGTIGRKPRDRLSHSDSSSPNRGQKQAADHGQFKPQGK